jgi:hypothetical protein
MERSDADASFAAKVGFGAGVFRRPSIYKRCDAGIRQRFGMAARAMGKAVEAFARARIRKTDGIRGRTNESLVNSLI